MRGAATPQAPSPQAVAGSPTRTRARRGDGAKLREEILRAATHMLIETGDEGAVSVRAVAERVGITPPSIYLHFGDKDELIFECCRMLMGRLTTEVLAAIDGVGDPLARLRLAAHTYVRFGIANPEPYRITFMSPNHQLPPDFDIAEYEGTISFQVLTAMVQEVMVAAGVDSGPTAEMRAMGLWSSCHGVTSLMIAKAVEPIDFPWPDVTTLVDHLLDVHLAALTAAAPEVSPS